MMLGYSNFWEYCILEQPLGHREDKRQIVEVGVQSLVSPFVPFLMPLELFW